LTQKPVNRVGAAWCTKL